MSAIVLPKTTEISHFRIHSTDKNRLKLAKNRMSASVLFYDFEKGDYPENSNMFCTKLEFQTQPKFLSEILDYQSYHRPS